MSDLKGLDHWLTREPPDLEPTEAELLSYWWYCPEHGAWVAPRDWDLAHRLINRCPECGFPRYHISTENPDPSDEELRVELERQGLLNPQDDLD